MYKIIPTALSFTAPGVLFAQSLDQSVTAVVNGFVDAVINPIIVLLFATALLLFFWGLFQLMVELSNGGDGADGKKHMLWGIIGMVIMFSVGGIINLMANSIGAKTTEVQVDEL